MPRHRKYDYQKDLPVRLFLNVPVYIINQFEELSITIPQKEIEKIVENFLLEFVEKARKKD